MRKVLLLVAVFIIASVGVAEADFQSMTSNASPATVDLVNNTSQEIIFPQVVRHVSIFNYDVGDGLWVNWRGADTDGVGFDGRNAKRMYIGPSSVVTLNNFQTDRITLVQDSQFTGAGASPISVLGLY